jgi:hypothetical protein
MEKVHHAIIRRNNILKLKEREETLQEQVWEALEQDDHEDDPNTNRAIVIYAKKMSHMLHASTSYKGERF